MLGHAHALRIGNADSKPRQAVSVERADLQALGHLARLTLVETIHAGAALKQGRNLDALNHDETAGALGPEQRLVSSEAQHVHSKRGRYVDGDGACSLRRIEREERPRLMGKRRHASHVVHVVGAIRGVHVHDEAERLALGTSGGEREKRLAGIPVERLIRHVGRDIDHTPRSPWARKSGRSTELRDAAVVRARSPRRSRPAIAVLSAHVTLGPKATRPAPGPENKSFAAQRHS